MKHLNKWLLALLTILLISSFFHLVEVHAQTESITYSGGYVTVSGFSEGSECTSWDVWNASSVNGWNVAFQNIYNDTQYAFNCTIIIHDAYFADENREITFFGGNDQEAYIISDNGHFRSGTLLDATNKTTSNGNSYLIEDYWALWYTNSSSSEILIYDTKCTDLTPQYVDALCNEGEGNVTVYSSTFSNFDEVDILNNGADWWNVMIQNGDLGIYLSASVSLDRVSVLGATRALYIFSPCNLTNFYERGTNGYVFLLANFIGNVKLVNPDVGAWNIYFLNPNQTLYRQYTFDLTTTAGSRIEITYYGQGGGTIFNVTVADGVVPTQTISKEFYNQTGGNTPYSYEPFHLKISKDGCQTYEANFTLSEKTSWEIALQEDGNGEAFNTTYYLLGGISILPFMLLFALLIRRKQNGS